jgi:catechol-2,3-dioxygenase
VGPDAQPIPQGRRVGMYHFGLKVGDSDDELRAARDAVIAAGATIVGLTDHVVTHSLYVRDPDGNEIELYVDVPDVDWKNNPSLMMERRPPLQI